MASTKTKNISLAALAIAGVVAATLLAFHFSGESPGSVRAELLRYVPAAATSLLFIDPDQLRASPFTPTLYSRAPQPAEDSEYTQFMADTGFNYERDLSPIFIAVSNHGARSNTFVVAEGKFDRKKIES